MKASDKCKQAGLKNLGELSKITGRSKRTLQSWSTNTPEFFDIVIRGANASKNAGQN